jgi:hypothetical protein
MSVARSHLPRNAASRCLAVGLPVLTPKAARGGPSGVARRGCCYGQLEVRVTVFEVIAMPGWVGVLSESADVPEAVAE